MTAHQRISQQPGTPDVFSGYAAAGQAQALSLLLAEMQALSALLPGVVDPAQDDEEVEACFDNMPV